MTVCVLPQSSFWAEFSNKKNMGVKTLFALALCQVSILPITRLRFPFHGIIPLFFIGLDDIHCLLSHRVQRWRISSPHRDHWELQWYLSGGIAKGHSLLHLQERWESVEGVPGVPARHFQQYCVDPWRLRGQVGARFELGGVLMTSTILIIFGFLDPLPSWDQLRILNPRNLLYWSNPLPMWTSFKHGP